MIQEETRKIVIGKRKTEQRKSNGRSQPTNRLSGPEDRKYGQTVPSTAKCLGTASPTA